MSHLVKLIIRNWTANVKPHKQIWIYLQTSCKVSRKQKFYSVLSYSEAGRRHMEAAEGMTEVYREVMSLRAWSSSSLMALYFSFWAYSSSGRRTAATDTSRKQEGQTEGRKQQREERKDTKLDQAFRNAWRKGSGGAEGVIKLQQQYVHKLQLPVAHQLNNADLKTPQHTLSSLQRNASEQEPLQWI